MDIKELKKMIRNSTAVLVLDDGEPSFVIVDYKAYKELVMDRNDDGEKEVKITSEGSPNGRHIHEKESEILDRLNKEILAIKTQIELEESGQGDESLTN